MSLGAVPWNRCTEKRLWTDTDNSGFYWYMETYYGITARNNMYDALAIVGEQNKINDVRVTFEVSNGMG